MKPTAKEESALRQIRQGMEAIREIHGNPVHIGAGIAQEGEGTLFLYLTNCETHPIKNERWLETSEGQACLMFHKVKRSGPKFFRKILRTIRWKS